MIGIMSDSHDNLDAVNIAVQIFNSHECRLVIHAGDFVAPFSARATVALLETVTMTAKIIPL